MPAPTPSKNYYDGPPPPRPEPNPLLKGRPEVSKGIWDGFPAEVRDFFRKLLKGRAGRR